MRSFFDPSAPVLTPADLVLAFTGAAPEALLLPRRAVIVFTPADLDRLARETGAEPVPVWRPFKRLYRPRGKETVLARSWVGGPAVAALVEELAAFRVREFCLWGYCGGISADVRVGDVILATAAFREEGVSSHYLEDEDELVGSEWAAQWELPSKKARILAGPVWTCDALYRETAEKVARYAERGVLGVEMEVASFYAVCKQKGLKAMAFLVVSDVVRPDGWESGFKSTQLQKGAARLSAYIRKYVLV
ncbi:MAG: nucleoside phosphorylase [Syntrophorhabdales bacterium]|jgi:uridine phosphorylase